MNKFLTILKESLDFLSIVNYTIKIQLMKGLGGLGIGSQVFGMKHQGLGTGDWVVNNNRMLGIHYYQCPRGSNYLGYSLSHVKIKNMDNNRMQTSPRNPDHLSYQRHKKQQFWQILAPVGLGFLIMAAVIALMILTATKGDPGAQISGWADTSPDLADPAGIAGRDPGSRFALRFGLFAGTCLENPSRLYRHCPSSMPDWQPTK